MKRLIFGLLLCLATLGVYAQASLNLTGSHNVIDTVTNTGTTTWTSSRVAIGGSVTVYVSVTKISGTVGGTITLQGSWDGTTWKALNTAGTQTALATITATDATNTYHWILTSNPFPYYRVSWTGTGTMAAKAIAKLQAR